MAGLNRTAATNVPGCSGRSFPGLQIAHQKKNVAVIGDRLSVGEGRAKGAGSRWWTVGAIDLSPRIEKAGNPFVLCCGTGQKSRPATLRPPP